MYEIDLDELADYMLDTGEVRGAVLCTDSEYLQRHMGEATLRSVEEEAKNIGYPIEYDKINRMDWYPIGNRMVSLAAIKKTLDWGDQEMEAMGFLAPRYSIITKLMLNSITNV